ncbi:MAG: hypothetical protein WAM28_05035 [Chlamydiales bacterium]
MSSNLEILKDSFLQDTFKTIANQYAFSDPLEALLLDEFVEECDAFDQTPLQVSWSWRNTHVARELAILLIDEKGELNPKILSQAIQILAKSSYSLGPNRHHDRVRQQHLLRTLRLFYEDKEAVYALKRINKPESPSSTEQLIRETLFLPEKISLTHADARQAVLAALLTNLRQNVGSCFATAPAILIQQDQPLRFLDDMGQLIGTGRLKRTYEGVEYSVPLSISWGAGDLHRPFYLASLGRYPLKTLALSPGLQAALEAGGLIDFKASPSKRLKACEKLLAASSLKKKAENPFALLTADQIIKETLQAHWEITENDLIQFQNRPSMGIIGEIAIQSPTMQKGKSFQCRQYQNGYEQAKIAFKALTDNALLKAWEFTLASLSETKANATKWNFYASLGVRPEEPHGIGAGVYAKIKERVEQFNEELKAIQSRYDHTFAQVKYLEGRINRASSETELNWLRADYQIHRQEINRALNERDIAYEKGQKLSTLFPFLIDAYGEKIPDYFQEIYDAEMHEITAHFYDDSPAGFRLLYKHGRTNPSLWTMIYTPSEYIQYLSSFFISVENELNQKEELEGLQAELSELTSTIITTLKSSDFLESSFYRLGQAYREPVIQNPLANIDKIKRKPWAYVSGGNMETLLSCYYSRAQAPRKVSQWVESPNELLAFFIDCIKELPHNVQKLYKNQPERSMLAFSPTHAFVLKPGWSSFREGWEDDSYTYTWIRDQWAAKQQNFLNTTELTSQMMDYLVSELLYKIPIGYRSVLKKALNPLSYSLSPPEFREKVIHALAYEKWIKQEGWLDVITEELDSILYAMIPLFPEYELEEKLEILFNSIEEISTTHRKMIYKILRESKPSIGKHNVLSAKDLRNIAKGLLMHTLNETRLSIPFHQKITRIMQNKELAYPQPILVADSNWVNTVFGFTVNPGTGQIEFWRFDDCGSEGRPITPWKNHLDGTDQREWGVYTAPHEYGQS